MDIGAEKDGWDLSRDASKISKISKPEADGVSVCRILAPTENY